MSQALVICPAYVTSQNGRAETLKRALESVCDQTSKAIALVVDDSSPVDVSQITSQFPQETVRYVRREKPVNENRTSAGALNHGIDLLLDTPDEVFSESEKSGIKGICYLHSDDRLPEDSIEKRLGVLNSGFVYGQTNIIDGDRSYKMHYPRSKIQPFKRIFNFPSHTLMWERDFLSILRDRNKVYFNSGVFDTELTNSEDFVASSTSIMAAHEYSLPIEELDSHIYDYIVNPDSISGTTNHLKRIKSNCYIAKKYGLGNGFLISELLRPMTLDFPYSLLTYLPEETKSKLRPLRDKLKGL